MKIWLWRLGCLPIIFLPVDLKARLLIRWTLIVFGNECNP